MIHTFPANDPYLASQFDRYGVVHIPGFIDKFDALELRQHLYDSFNPALDGTGVVAPGSRAQVWRDVPDGPLPRRLRMFYEPPMRWVFQQLVGLRNYLMGEIDPDAPNSGWWTAARFNHYPRGGGFMAPHEDLPFLPGFPFRRYAQPILFLSHKGSHYREGGGTVNGEDVDAMCEPGDVVVYGGMMRHSVEPVDPHVRPTPGSLDGRLVAMVTLYKERV